MFHFTQFGGLTDDGEGSHSSAGWSHPVLRLGSNVYGELVESCLVENPSEESIRNQPGQLDLVKTPLSKEQF